MSWAVQEFLQSVLDNLVDQGYRIDSFSDPRELGEHGGAWRCSVQSPDEEMPGSIVIKRAYEGMAFRWQDWSCQYFITDQPGTRGLGPEFFAGDEGVGFYALEDLGLGADPGRALQYEDSRSRLAAGLLAGSLAGLHAGTFGRERQFGVLRERLPGGSPDRAKEQIVWRLAVEEALNGLEPGLAKALEPQLALLQDEMADPREFLVLTHGDWDARSLWYGDPGPRFLSFGNGAFRHALQDLAAWELRCLANAPAWDTLCKEYLAELERLGAERGPRTKQAHARARGWMGLWHLGQGRRIPGVKGLLELASQDPGMAPLSKVAGLL